MKKVIFKCYVGSIAHNLYVPPESDKEFGTCDKDYMEYFVYPRAYYLGLKGYHKESATVEFKKGDIDLVGHEIRKAMFLLSKGNPNLLVTLFGNPKNFITLSKGGKMLVKHRELFIGAKQVYERFGGFASDQLHKLKQNSYNGYMGEKRKRMVDKFGYDAKNAMTLIRLLREGVELLSTGDLTIYKTGKERRLLMDIKTAKYKLEDIKEMSEGLFKEMKYAYENTVLPQTIKTYKIDKLLQRIIEVEVLNPQVP